MRNLLLNENENCSMLWWGEKGANVLIGVDVNELIVDACVNANGARGSLSVFVLIVGIVCCKHFARNSNKLVFSMPVPTVKMWLGH